MADPVFVVTMTGRLRHIQSPAGRWTLCGRRIDTWLNDSTPLAWSAWPLCRHCEAKQTARAGRALARAGVGAIRIQPPEGRRR